MPVEMFVIVPTSRGISCGVKASRTWLIPANARSKTLCKLSGAVFIGLCLGLVFSLAGLTSGLLRFGAGFGYQLWLRLRFGLSFSFRSSPTPFSSDAR